MLTAFVFERKLAWIWGISAHVSLKSIFFRLHFSLLMFVMLEGLPFSLWLEQALNHRIIPQAQFYLGQESLLEFGKPTRKLHPSIEVLGLPGLFGLKVLVGGTGIRDLLAWFSDFGPAPWLGPCFCKNVCTLRP